MRQLFTGGPGLVERLIDVHRAQWGNLSRLAEGVRCGDGRPGWAIDEHATLECRDGAAVAVHREGAAWHVERPADGSVAVQRRREGPL